MPFRRRWIRSLPLVLPLILLPALGASAANWLDLQQANGVAYFLVQQSTGPSIARRQLDGSETGAPLGSIKLSATPSAPLAFFVTPAGTIYVAYPNRIDQVDETGKAVVTIPITAGTLALYGIGSFLFVVRSDATGGTTVQPIDINAKTAGDLQKPSTRQTFGFAFAPTTAGDPAVGRVFAFSSDASTDLLVSFSIGGGDGSAVGSAVEAPISTPFGAGRLFPFADGTRVADANGTVYSASDALALDSFGGAVTSLAFRGDVPIVLRGAQIVSFTNTLDQAALKTLPLPGASDPPLPSAILVQGDRVYAFSDDNNQTNGVPNIFSTRSFSLLDDPDLKFTPQSGNAIEPEATAFTPTGVAFDAVDGTLYLLDSADFRLFRWSTSTTAYLAPPVVLTDTPRFLAVSHANGQVYLGYSDGAVKKLAIGATSSSDIQDLLDVKAPLCGLVPTNALLVTCQKGASSTATTTAATTPSRQARRGGRGGGGGATGGLYTSFGADGIQIAQAAAPVGDGLIWSPAAESLYFLVGSGTLRGGRGPQIAALPVAGNGSFGSLVTRSVSSRASRRQSSSSPVLPLATTADGSTLVLASGQELDAQDLSVLSGTVPAPSGAGPLVDAATAGSDLWTFRSVGGGAEADRIGSDNGLAARALFEGVPLRLFARSDGSDLVTLTNVGGIPTPTLWPIASAQALAGKLRFGSTSATPLFDLAAINYTQAGSNSELTFKTIGMTEAGELELPDGPGEIQFLVKTPPETVTVGLSGSLAGSHSSTEANLRFTYDGTLNGQPYTGTATLQLTAFDAASNALTGSQTLNLTIGRQRVNKSGPATWTLPQGVDGSWSLEVTLNPPAGDGTITGSALLQVHPAASDQVTPSRVIGDSGHPVHLSGTVDSTTGHATLSDDGSDADFSLSLTDLAPLARGAEGTVTVRWLGQSRSADLTGAPAN